MVRRFQFAGTATDNGAAERPVAVTGSAVLVAMPATLRKGTGPAAFTLRFEGALPHPFAWPGRTLHVQLQRHLCARSSGANRFTAVFDASFRSGRIDLVLAVPDRPTLVVQGVLSIQGKKP